MTEPAPPAADAQALLFARDVARLNRLRRAYERLVPARLDPEAPGIGDALVRDCTAMFTDLRHFTRLMEGFADDPVSVMRVVNEHLAVAVGAVTRCGGVVEKFVGDGLLATFGARADQADHRERAVAAALGVIGANEALNRRRSADWGFRLDVGAGVASGRIVMGLLGPPERAELGILGDAVNVASRLVGLARPGEVLLSGSVYHGLAGSDRKST